MIHIIRNPVLFRRREQNRDGLALGSTKYDLAAPIYISLSLSRR